MPYIQFQDRQFPLGSAELTVGAFEGAAVHLPGDDPKASAVLTLGADGTGLIRRGGPDAVVMLNGLQLGMEPSPIFHGDKVELGGHALRYGADNQDGSTQVMSARKPPESLRPKAGAPRTATTAAGGRLVSLMDGREYPVPDAGVTLGREIGCDIVIPSTDASRRHATVGPVETGYVLTDTSTNGVFVNGTRISKTHVLSRGDVVKIGPEEFRFYADVLEPAPAAPASATAASAPPLAPALRPAPAPVAATPPVSSSPAAAPPTLPLSAVPSLSNTAFVMRPRTPSAAAPPFAAPPSLAPPPAAPPSAAPPPAAPPLAAPPSAALPDAATSGPTSAAVPGLSTRKPLAILEITNEGLTRGKKFVLFTPLTNVGRGEHNDVCIGDESVSDSHANIYKREGAWWIVDQGSTNGTYLGGRRVQAEEQQILGAPDVRFGNVKMLFRPTATAEEPVTGTRAIAPRMADAAKRMPVGQPRSSTSAPRSTATPRSTGMSPRPSGQVPTAPDPQTETQVAKKGCLTVVAFLVALAAMGTSMLVVLLATRT